MRWFLLLKITYKLCYYRYVEKVTEKYIEIKYFDYMAKWDEDEFDMVYYDDISVVSFGKRYIKYMSKYTH